MRVLKAEKVLAAWTVWKVERSRGPEGSEAMIVGDGSPAVAPIVHYSGAW